MESKINPWRFDKSIGVTHILSAFMIAVSLLTCALVLDRRIQKNAQKITFIEQKQASQEARFNATRTEIRQDLHAINNKLDRLIERQATSP